MNKHIAYREKMTGVLMAMGILLAGPGATMASESDPWTYAHIPLADSAVLVSEQLKKSIEDVIEVVNTKLRNRQPFLADTAVEFAFFTEFRSRNIRDITWGMFERCIGTNNCTGWPQFERIQMHPEESVYHAAKWRYIPSKFHIASIVDVCGVRMGADKLTHFFDDGFHYFNALRSKSKDFDPEDIRQLSMAFEKSYMGARLTGIVSRADIEANLAGVLFYSDIFIGPSPMIGRDTDGKIHLLRQPDICDYVTVQFDERVLLNDFVYGLLDSTHARERSQNLLEVISQRSKQSATLARDLSMEQLILQKKSILTRRIPMTQWQKDFPKLRMIGHAGGFVSHWLFDPGLRRASSLFSINPLKTGKLGDRKPVTIHRKATLIADAS